jgi:hypothetical protein
VANIPSPAKWRRHEQGQRGQALRGRARLRGPSPTAISRHQVQLTLSGWEQLGHAAAALRESATAPSSNTACRLHQFRKLITQGARQAAVPARCRDHAAIARCRCGLRSSPRLSTRKPSPMSVSPRRARSSPRSVSLGICPGGPRKHAANEPTPFGRGRSLPLVAADWDPQSDARQVTALKPVTAPSLLGLGRLATGFEPAMAGRREAAARRVGAPARHRDGLDEAHDHAPLLRFLMLVTAGSAEGRCFVLRLPANGNSNAG